MHKNLKYEYTALQTFVGIDKKKSAIQLRAEFLQQGGFFFFEKLPKELHRKQSLSLSLHTSGGHFGPAFRSLAYLNHRVDLLRRPVQDVP